MTAAHNTSSTSLYLSWQAPELNTIHGEFLGYKISYRPRDISEAKSVDIPIENPRATVRQNYINIIILRCRYFLVNTVFYYQN